MNYMKQVAEILGLKLYEKFDILGGFHECSNPHKITILGMVNKNGDKRCSPIQKILIGEYKIKRLEEDEGYENDKTFSGSKLYKNFGTTENKRNK